MELMRRAWNPASAMVVRSGEDVPSNGFNPEDVEEGPHRDWVQKIIAKRRPGA